MEESVREPWWLNTLYVFIGGFIGFISAYGTYLLRSKHTDKKIQRAVIAEVGVNVEYGMKRDPHWFTNVYQKNLDKISAIQFENLEKIVRFYARIEQYQDREARGLRDQERLKQEDLWKTHVQSLFSLSDEIVKWAKKFSMRLLPRSPFFKDFSISSRDFFPKTSGSENREQQSKSLCVKKPSLI